MNTKIAPVSISERVQDKILAALADVDPSSTAAGTMEFPDLMDSTELSTVTKIFAVSRLLRPNRIHA